MTQNTPLHKMIHVRNPSNNGVVSFRTKVDWANKIIVWDMVVCSKKDTFVKSKSTQLCSTNPLKTGVVPFNKQIINNVREMHSTGQHLYFHQLVIQSAMQSSVLVDNDGNVRHQPKWVDKLLAVEYATAMCYATI